MKKNELFCVKVSLKDLFNIIGTIKFVIKVYQIIFTKDAFNGH